MERGDVTVRVPAATAYLQVLRAVTAAVASGVDMSIDEIDDLRLATTEAAEHLLSCYPEISTLTLHLRPREDGLEVVVSASGDGRAPLVPREPGEEGPEELFTWEVLNALVEAPRTVHLGDEPGVAFVKRATRWD